MYKVFVCVALLAVASAEYEPITYSYYGAPKSAPAPAVALPVAKYVVSAAPAYSQYKEEENYGPAKYEFVYGIADPHTGDFHSQEEKRDGKTVVGQYSLKEADGTVRVVKYSDDGHGFNAVVENQGKPTEAPAAYKKVLAVPVPKY